ncbi:hypothetical protein [Cupriavidus oxalaticus]|uniref:hypothetical protein n=1 Tax=Cupriavidus oxalaticus TaxID=96344 RepID=UPI0040342384
MSLQISTFAMPDNPAHGIVSVRGEVRGEARNADFYFNPQAGTRADAERQAREFVAAVDLLLALKRYVAMDVQQDKENGVNTLRESNLYKTAVAAINKAEGRA